MGTVAVPCGKWTAGSRVGPGGKMIEEPHEVLFESDYEVGYPQLRYDRCVPCKCPFCDVWSHHLVQRRNGRSLVICPLCDKTFDAGKYQKRAVRRFRNCLKDKMGFESSYIVP